MLGITVQGERQLVFVDTPGIFVPRPAKRLEQAMVKAAWQGVDEADRMVLVLDAKRGLDADSQLVLRGLQQRRVPACAAINKLDLVRPQKTLPLIKTLSDTGRFDRVFLVSAQSGDGCGDLLDYLLAGLPLGPWLFPADQLSDLSQRAMAAELTREQLFRQLHQELPYSLTVETEQWLEAPDGKEIRIDQTIYVERDSHKKIVLGKGGRQIKSVGEMARKELEQMLDARVHLFLFVKVRPNWTEDPERFAELGLER